MASSVNHMLSIFLVILFFHSSRSSREYINQICNVVMDYELCVEAFYSDHRSVDADWLGLTKISIDLLFKNCSDTWNFIGRLLKNTTDPKMKKCLSDCRDYYEYSIESINDAKKHLLLANETLDVSKDLDDPSVYAHLCNESFNSYGFEELPLLRRNYDAFVLSGISGEAHDQWTIHK